MSVYAAISHSLSRWLKAPLSIFGRTKDVPKPATDGTLAISSSSEQLSRYYVARAREKFKDGRYEAIRQLGTGRYSNVWLAKDLQRDSFVALKMLTSDCYGTDHDIFELEILKTITRQQTQISKEDSFHVLGLEDNFRLTGPNGTHECIVMPVIGCDMIAQARRFSEGRVPVQIMKSITRQLLIGLAFLHDRCKVVHTDLHPSNICFEIGPAAVEQMVAGESASGVTPTITTSCPGSVRIIDFGVASWIGQHLSDNIQPEHLRAPEVILGAPWGTPVDIWSLGCLIIEFVKGHVAFPGAASKQGSWTSEDDHLAQYMEVLGPMPSELLRRGTKTNAYFDDQGTLLRIPKLRSTNLTAYIDGKKGPLQRPRDMDAEEVPIFVDFLRGALALDPYHRKTAEELLQHEWLQRAT